jgi:hypothetical protein
MFGDLPPLLSNNGAHYYVIFVYHFSKFTWFYPITCKYDVSSIFPKFQAYVECLFDHKIKSIQTDGGGEFQKLHHIFTSHGIHHRIMCPHTHQQNGSVECKHRHIVEMGLTLMAHCSASLTYWTKAFQTACYLINRLLHPSLTTLPPFKNYFNFGLITILCEYSIVLVGLIFGPITSINLICAPTHAYLLAIAPLIVATSAFTLQLDAFIFLAMLYLMSRYFPSLPFPLPHPRLLLPHSPLFSLPSFQTPPPPHVIHVLQFKKILYPR